MAIKIYNAYRLKPGVDLWKFVEHVRVRAEKRVKRTLTHFYIGLLSDATKSKRVRTEIRQVLALPSTHVRAVEYNRRLNRRPLDTSDISRFVLRSFERQAFQSDRHLFDLSVSIAITRIGRTTVVRLFSGSGLLSSTLNFVQRMPEVEDFHYQNSSDKPTHISASKWSTRERFWSRALDDVGYIHPQLVLEIVSRCVCGRCRIALLRREVTKTLRSGSIR